MDSKVIAGGAVGAVTGAVGGYLLGRYIERKEHSIEKGLASEFLGLFASLAGGVTAAAVAYLLTQNDRAATNPTAITLPPKPVGSL